MLQKLITFGSATLIANSCGFSFLLFTPFKFSPKCRDFEVGGPILPYKSIEDRDFED
jgi:hypothetical protein